ncbi:hypothetical protein PFISCL1PPCAC_1896, partial [Pristionchus fissidentatus]
SSEGVSFHLERESPLDDIQRKRSDSSNSDRSIASMSSAEFLMHAGSSQRRRDSDARREAEQRRIEEHRRQLEMEKEMDGDKNSTHELDLKGIKKKLIKKKMLRKKKSSQDSEVSVVERKKSIEEQKAERRKQKSELRFLKNVGLQTDFASEVSSKESTEVLTQTHRPKNASRRSQTKLTSIEKPVARALQEPLSIRRKISDPSRLSIISLSSPHSPLDLLDIASHGLRDLSQSPFPISEGSTPIDGPTTSDSVPRPSILPMEDTVNGTEKMTRRRSEVEKRVRRRKRPDATASETLRESISSASSLTSLALSPDPANCTVSYDEDGARVVEVSLNVFLFNGQLDQSGYQYVIDPIQKRKQEEKRDSPLPSSDGIKRIQIKYDWEEEEIEDEEDEERRGGMEIIGDEDEVESWWIVAETQTELEVIESGIQLNRWEIENWREEETQTEKNEEEMPIIYRDRPIPSREEIAVQTDSKILSDTESQVERTTLLENESQTERVEWIDGATQTVEISQKIILSTTMERTSQTDPPPLVSIPEECEVAEIFTQTEESPVTLNSEAQTENVSPLLDSQPFLSDNGSQTITETFDEANQIAIPSPSIDLQDESAQTDVIESIECIEGSSQTESIESEKQRDLADSNVQTDSEIVKESIEIETQTVEIVIEKEEKDTQYDEIERVEICCQTEENIRKEKESQVYLDISEVEIQTDVEPKLLLNDQECQSDQNEISEVEIQTDEIDVTVVERVEKEVQSDLLFTFDAQTECEGVEKIDRECHSIVSAMLENESQTDAEAEMNEQGTQHDDLMVVENESQTEKEEGEERECQTEEEGKQMKDGYTETASSFFQRTHQECQYSFDTVDDSTQFDEISWEETGSQTEKEEIEKGEIECQTDSDPSVEREDAATGTETVFTSEMGTETEAESERISTSSQSNSTMNSEIQKAAQTERDCRHTQMQTDEVKRKLKKKVEKAAKDCQTDR